MDFTWSVPLNIQFNSNSIHTFNLDIRSSYDIKYTYNLLKSILGFTIIQYDLSEPEERLPKKNTPL